MRPAILGRPSWSPGTWGGLAGLPLLGECHCCWPVLKASPSPPARRARHHCQQRVPVAVIRLGRGCWRANLVHLATEARLIRLSVARKGARSVKASAAGKESRGHPLAQGPGDGASPQRFGNSANRRRLALRRCRSGSATRPAGGLGAADYAARRSGRNWAVISSNHGWRWMASARCFMRK